jgi:hypothetical protein
LVLEGTCDKSGVEVKGVELGPAVNIESVTQCLLRLEDGLGVFPAG